MPLWLRGGGCAGSKSEKSAEEKKEGDGKKEPEAKPEKSVKKEKKEKEKEKKEKVKKEKKDKKDDKTVEVAFPSAGTVAEKARVHIGHDASTNRVKLAIRPEASGRPDETSSEMWHVSAYTGKETKDAPMITAAFLKGKEAQAPAAAPPKDDPPPAAERTTDRKKSVWEQAGEGIAQVLATAIIEQTIDAG